MEVTINTLSDIRREAEFMLTSDDLQPHFENAYKKAAPKIELKGFRKGKVPMAMIKKLYGDAIEQDALEGVANETFRLTMIERSIEPLGRPALTDMDFKRGEHFKFKIAYEVKPTVVLKAYKGIEVLKPVHHVTEKDIDAEIERLRRIHASLLGVTLVRDTDDHVITADVQELADDGMPLIGKKTPGARFSLSDPSLVQEIKDVLMKSEVGGAYRVRFEQQHGEHSHRHFIELSVKKIEKVELPDVDDAFIRKITQDKVQTKEEFLSNLRKDLESYWAEQSDRSVSDGIINEIVRLHDIAVPESLVNLYLDSFVEDVKNRTRDRQLPKGFDETKFRSENRVHAIHQAKWALLRERIIEEERVSVSDEEIEQAAAAEAASIGISKDELLKYYNSSSAATERLRTNKLMKLLREAAVVTEKVVDERVLA